MTAPRLSARRFALLLCLPAACHTWRPIELAPPRTFGSNARVSVERMDSSTIVLYGPRIVGDSVVTGADTGSNRFAIAVADVRRAQEYRFSVTRTAFAGLGVVVGVVVVAGVIVGSMIAGLSGEMGSVP